MGLDAKFFYRLLRVFAVAFAGVFVTFVVGILSAPDLTTAKSLAYAAIAASLSAAAHAVMQTLTQGQAPFPGAGVLPPPN